MSRSPLILVFPLLAVFDSSATGGVMSSGFRAEGRSEIRHLAKDQVLTQNFSIQSSGSTFLIRAFGSINPDTSGEEFFWDGSLGHNTKLLSPDRLAPTVGIDPKSQQPFWDTNRLAKPRNDVELYLRESPVPEAASLIPIFLAFASIPFLDDLSGDKMEKLFDVERRGRSAPLLVPFRLERSRSGLRLPAKLMTLEERFGTTTTNELFRVDEWKDDLPMRFTFEIYRSSRPPRGELLTTIQFLVTNFVTATVTDLRPTLEGEVSVTDERFASDKPRIRSVEYWVTNGIVPSKATIASSPAYAAALESERAGSIPPVQRIWYVLLSAALLFPLVWMGWWIKQKQKHQIIR